MARGRKQRSGGRGLPGRRVEWLPVNDSGQDVTMDFDEVTVATQLRLYDFGGALKYADNLGGGDWTIERSYMTVGAAMINRAAGSRLVKICVGIGFIQTATSVSSSVELGDVGTPNAQPELSWMIMLCCYINTEQIQVERCEVVGGSRARRRISPESQMVVAARVSNTMIAGDDLTISIDTRFLAA